MFRLHDAACLGVFLWTSLFGVCCALADFCLVVAYLLVVVLGGCCCLVVCFVLFVGVSLLALCSSLLEV